MDREQINQKLKELEKEIRNSYNNASILEKICTLEAVPENIEHGTYKQFVGKYKINRDHITDPTHFLIMGELGTSLASSEIKFLIDSFSNCDTLEIETFSIEKIKEKTFSMISYGYNPNTIFIPIEYFHDIHDWNKTHKPPGSEGNIFDRLYLDSTHSLLVKYSNKKIEFEDVIITSKEVNNWKYRPDAETRGRATVKFDWDAGDDENCILLVKTVYKFRNEDTNGNTVLKIKDFQKKTN